MIPHWSTGHPQTCLVAPALPALCLSPLSPELRALSAPFSRTAGPPPPSPGCGSPWPRSRPGKFLGPGPAGGGCCRCLCGKEPGARSPLTPRRPLLRVGTPDFQAAHPFGSPGVVEGAFGASAARRAPCGPPGATCVQSCLGNLPRGGSARRVPSPKTLSSRQEHAVWLPVCPARWHGRERRGQCLLLLTKGSRSSSPAERPAVLHPASRSRHRRAQWPRGVPSILAACSGRRAGSRNTEAWGRGEGGGRCRRECSSARRLQSPSLQLRSCRTREQQVAEDSESSAPTCRAPGPGELSAGATVPLSGRLSAWAVPFVYTLEDTQLRKHRRRHAVENGDVRGC